LPSSQPLQHARNNGLHSEQPKRVDGLSSNAWHFPVPYVPQNVCSTRSSGRAGVEYISSSGRSS
jgi:hypothetical protein